MQIISTMPYLTRGFIFGILCLTLIFHSRFKEKTVVYGPTILTTIGIFATFIGIAIGMSGFDVANIQASVPSLLSGLKTAFWASVAGVGAALTIKIRHFFLGVKSSSESGSGDASSVDDLARSMRGIHWALAGDDDDTVVSQLKLLRQDSNDRLDALRKAQTESLQMLTQMSSAALVEALRDVIRDFNAKINEQFGDNFRQLNEGVAKLLVWQEQYKTQVESTSDSLRDVVEQMKATTENHAKMVEQGLSFSEIANDLSSMLTGLETQKAQLLATTKSLGELLTAASGSIPQIEKKIVEIATQLSQATSDNQRILSAALNENAATVKKSIEASVQETSKAHQEQSRQIVELLKRSKDQIEVLDAGLTEQLTKALDSLGRQLAALSEKFVNDYTPLTERLKQVVDIAKRAQ